MAGAEETRRAYACGGGGAAAEEEGTGGGVMGVVLQIWREWDTTIMVVAGAGLQLALVAAGFVRKRVVTRSFHAAVWVVYVGVEAVSMYSLGLMFASGCDHIYAIWAPLTLFHLSAADAINAYSPADNELWRRYLFKLLLLSVSAASSIVYRARRCRRYFFAALLLTLVATFKLCERVFSLYCASRHRILVASRPIYAFMASAAPRCSSPHLPYPDALLVAGEWQWYARHRRLLHTSTAPSSSSSSHDHLDFQQQKLDLRARRASSNSYPDIEGDNRSFLFPLAYRDDVVLYLDIREDKELRNRPEILELCLAYALFKIYRRRLSNLRIRLTPTHRRLIRDFFLQELNASCNDPPHKSSISKLFRLLDLEMSFIFDSVFTKAAAGATFQGVGMLTRLISLGVLLVALFTLVAVQALNVGCSSNDGDEAAARGAGLEGPVVEGLTFLVLVVALAVECLQFYRHIKSDFFRVWLAYTYVQINKWQQQQQADYRRRRKTELVLCNYCAAVILTLLDYASAAQSNSRFNSRCLGAFFQQLRQRCLSASLDVGGNHWHYTVKQRSILAETVAKLHRKYRIQLDIEGMRDADSWKESIKPVGGATDVEELQAFLAEKIRETLKKEEGQQDLRESFAEAIVGPLRTNGKTAEDAKPLELVALYYHLATSVCELQMNAGKGGEEEKNEAKARESRAMKMSVLLSRYCLHLLLRRPSLIGVDPDLVTTRYGRYRGELEAAFEKRDGGEEKRWPPCVESVTEAMKKAEDRMGGRRESGKQLKEWIEKMATKSDRWERLCDAWVGILVFMAVGSGGAAPPHAELMARGGGELLTLLWLLLTHLMDDGTK